MALLILLIDGIICSGSFFLATTDAPCSLSKAYHTDSLLILSTQANQWHPWDGGECLQMPVLFTARGNSNMLFVLKSIKIVVYILVQRLR